MTTLNSLFNNTYASTKYPPYDIMVDDDKYYISVALAGFTKEQLQVREDKGSLIISSGGVRDEDVKYIKRGIAKRGFELAFSLDASLIVSSVSLKDGLLTVALTRDDRFKPVTHSIQ